MVADAGTAAAAVWTGSTNFTVDAWALQENNIVVIVSADLAAQYTKDFDELWSTEKLTGTGWGNGGSVTVGGVDVRYAFAPGEGSAIETLIAQAIAGATTRLRVASTVTSSPAILNALKERIDAGIDFAGVYDQGETQGVISQWKKSATGADLRQRGAQRRERPRAGQHESGRRLRRLHRRPGGALWRRRARVTGDEAALALVDHHDQPADRDRRRGQEGEQPERGIASRGTGAVGAAHVAGADHAEHGD
jgi:phosphatidylserine/phosphatidylglycerophosphate/cardiolipin synthase-like enzyme